MNQNWVWLLYTDTQNDSTTLLFSLHWSITVVALAWLPEFPAPTPLRVFLMILKGSLSFMSTYGFHSSSSDSVAHALKVLTKLFFFGSTFRYHKISVWFELLSLLFSTPWLQLSGFFCWTYLQFNQAKWLNLAHEICKKLWVWSLTINLLNCSKLTVME